MNSKQLRNHVLNYSSDTTAYTFAACGSTSIFFQNHRRIQSLKLLKRIAKIQGYETFNSDGLSISDLIRLYNDRSYYNLNLRYSFPRKLWHHLKVAIAANLSGFDGNDMIRHCNEMSEEYLDFERGLFLYGYYAYLVQRENRQAARLN